jgi:hypothetical protein
MLIVDKLIFIVTYLLYLILRTNRMFRSASYILHEIIFLSQDGS